MSNALERKRLERHRKRGGLTRVVVWLPDADDFCDELHDRGFMADWRDRTGLAEAIVKVMADWKLHVTRDVVDPIPGDSNATCSETRFANTPQAKIQQRDAALRRAAEMIGATLDQSISISLALALQKYRGGAWLVDRVAETCPRRYRKTIEGGFWEALRCWDAALSAKQISHILGR